MDIGDRVVAYFERAESYSQEYITERCPGWLGGEHGKYKRPGAGGSFLEQTCFCGKMYGLIRALFD